MTTREQEIEALNAAAESDRRNAETMWQSGMTEPGNIAYRQREMTLRIAARLKRDGELIEKLETLTRRLRLRVETCASCVYVGAGPMRCGGCQARTQLADELSALLKEAT